jgi:hypothetical protein
MKIKTTQLRMVKLRDEDIKVLRQELADLLAEESSTINSKAYLCIAAELLAGNLCVQNAMIRSIYMLVQRP